MEMCLGQSGTSLSEMAKLVVFLVRSKLSMLLENISGKAFKFYLCDACPSEPLSAAYSSPYFINIFSHFYLTAGETGSCCGPFFPP